MTPAAPALEAQRRWLAHRRDAGAPDLVVGVAASFTANPLETFLGAHLLEAGVAAGFSLAEYDQIREVCFDPVGTLGPIDHLVILWRLEDLAGDALVRVALGDTALFPAIAAAAGELGQAIAGAARSAPFPVIVSVPPFPRPLGVDLADSSVGLRLGRAHAATVASFFDAIGDAPVRWADLNAWQLALGIDRSQDVVKAMAYKQPYSTDFWHLVGGNLGDIVLRESRPTPKCIVLDCDNTLWGGVIGEDGLGGIELGANFPGSGYLGLQKVLKSLKERGVLLAVASKNNPAEVASVFAEHDEMVLKSEDISVWRVNWNPKSQSLREIAAELNIGVDALLMLDDSDYEIAEIANAVPEAGRLQVPDEPALLPDLIASSGLFRNMRVSAEDLARTDMIHQETARREAATAMSREEFLASLELTLEFIEVGEQQVGRVAQLTNKTNQFNVTTIRRTEADIRALVADDDHIVRAMRVSDKFGDYGLVGVAILRSEADHWDVDTFLMSCRVLSRGIETAFLATLVREAVARSAKPFVAHYVATPKNPLVAELFPQHGFTATGDGEYRAEPADISPPPAHVRIR